VLGSHGARPRFLNNFSLGVAFEFQVVGHPTFSVFPFVFGVRYGNVSDLRAHLLALLVAAADLAGLVVGSAPRRWVLRLHVCVV